MKLNKFSRRNLDVIENFILHLTHSSPGDHNFDKKFEISANTMYQESVSYVEEDHVDGMGRVEADVAKYKVVSAANAVELTNKVTTLQDEGWCTCGSHLVVCMNAFDQYSGNQHIAVKYIYEYSQTLTRCL